MELLRCHQLFWLRFEVVLVEEVEGVRWTLRHLLTSAFVPVCHLSFIPELIPGSKLQIRVLLALTQGVPLSTCLIKQILAILALDVVCGQILREVRVEEVECGKVLLGFFEQGVDFCGRTLRSLLFYHVPVRTNCQSPAVAGALRTNFLLRGLARLFRCRGDWVCGCERLGRLRGSLWLRMGTKYFF